MKNTEIVSTEVVKITPHMAGRMLEKSGGNRNLDRRRVNQYAKQMRDGHWQTNGDPIRISEDGLLLDGQHRLNAIAMSGIPQQCNVITLGSKDDISALGLIFDRGKARGMDTLMGVSKASYAVVSCIIQSLIKNGGDLSNDPYFMEKAHNLIEPYMHYGLVGAKTRPDVGLRLNAPRRAALVIAGMHGIDGREDFANLARADFNLVSKRMMSFYKQSMDRRYGRAARMYDMALSWEALAPGKKPDSFVTLRKNGERQLREMREIVEELLSPILESQAVA